MTHTKTQEKPLTFLTFFFHFSFFIFFFFHLFFFRSFFVNSGQSRATNNPVAQHKRPTSAAAAKVSNDQARKKRSTKGPFALKVFFLGSSSAPCEIVVSSSDTLEVVKSKIEFQMGVPSERMHLFVGRRQVGNSSHGKKKGPTVGSVGLNPSNPELNVALS